VAVAHCSQGLEAEGSVCAVHQWLAFDQQLAEVAEQASLAVVEVAFPAEAVVLEGHTEVRIDPEGCMAAEATRTRARSDLEGAVVRMLHTAVVVLRPGCARQCALERKLAFEPIPE